ncbi:tetraacyldisaccharide 4'-kinase [Lichenicoccus sp.]|uniref:tetraacyldisaccharide 4'-kinase n=1 Tax=Lichenicoccus sp. TaxID=2781899 RepID=UPI003D1174F4
MRAPAFWSDTSAHVLPLLLSPLGLITAQATARRLRRPRWRAPVPVICCGNLVVGGSGKTTLALDILARLRRRGVAAHALTRGYGGAACGVVRVDPLLHDAALVGDEALLLARVADTWVSADRAAAARQAIRAGAQCLVMDDGMQNPGLVQDCVLLVIDGAAGFGNGRLLPAGPLRERIRDGAARARAAILIGPDQVASRQQLPGRLPVLPATLALAPDASRLQRQKLVAFAGIGRPEKFFSSLDQTGLEVVGRVQFPDHHRYRAHELDRLAAYAAVRNARLVTTPKDAVRLTPTFRPFVHVIDVALRWQQATAIEALLDEVMADAIM